MIMTVFSTLISILIVQIVIKAALFGKIKKMAAIIVFSGLLLAYLFFLLFFPEVIDKSGFNVAVIMFSVLASLVIFENIQKSQSLFFSILILGLMSTVSTSIMWIVAIIMPNVIDFPAADLITNSAILIIILITGKSGLLSRILYSITRVTRGMKALLLGSIWISALLATLFSILFNEHSDLPWLQFSGMLTATMIIMTGIMGPLLIVNNLSTIHYRNLSNVMNKQVHSQLEHYKSMSKMNENISKFQHDYKNMRIGLISFLNQNDVSGAMSFLETEHLMINGSASNFETGSVILDALLNEKQISAAAVNATIQFQGSVPEPLLNPADICVIFGNALDNAIEACAKLPKEEKKVIKIQSRFIKDFLFINIENPTAEDVQIINSVIATTKENKQSHGFGLRSILTAVEKYSGVMKIMCENGVFSMGIDLDFHV
ncbi:MAG: GHKL domain-containing protein [Oscillospiraceae bacterium]|nr:GHKL domain-containing protein [Oscillospiraceae bacterium]